MPWDRRKLSTAAAVAPSSVRNHRVIGPRLAALLREVSAQLSDQADDIALTMVRAYETEIPAYGQIADLALPADVRAVSSALVRCWLTVIADGQPAREVLLELTEGARRRAAQGIELVSMLRAYRIGIRVLWGEITATLAWRGRALQGVLAPVIALMSQPAQGSDLQKSRLVATRSLIAGLGPVNRSAQLTRTDQRLGD